MGARRGMRAFGAVLALAVSLLALSPGVGRADPGEEPDLKIEVVGLKDGSKRDVLVRVTNVSDWWADETEATIQAVGPGAGNVVKKKVHDLNTKDEAPLPDHLDLTYTLAADCKPGVTVRAALSTAVNYDGDKEKNLLNNIHEREVCPSAGSPAAKPGTGTEPAAKPGPATKPGGETPRIDFSALLLDPRTRLNGSIPPLVVLPEHKQPGQHTVTLDPNQSLQPMAVKLFRTWHNNCVLVPGEVDGPDQEGVLIGWFQEELDGGTPCMAAVWQLGLSFDDTVLREIPNKTIDRAVLSFDEEAGLCWKDREEDRGWESCWTNGDGEPQPKPNGCVIVGVPTADWRNGTVKGLIPTAARSLVKRITPREWHVTDHFSWQLDSSTKPLTMPGTEPIPTGFGFLLSGNADINKLESEDNTRCTSAVKNVRLQVTYTVRADDGEPFRQPK